MAGAFSIEPRHFNRKPFVAPDARATMTDSDFWRELAISLTNAFSKKLANLKAAVALHFAYYNYCRVNSSLRVTPAMQAGLTDHIWTVAELLA